MGELYDPSVTQALSNALENKSTPSAPDSQGLRINASIQTGYPKTRRASMSGQVKTGGNESKNNMMSRRTTLTLAAAVATFGAAMGMRAPAAWAQGKMEGDSDERRNYDRDRDVERNRDRDYDRDGERRGEGRGDG
jgi:hypothetical protein